MNNNNKISFSMNKYSTLKFSIKCNYYSKFKTLENNEAFNFSGQKFFK